MKMFAAAALFAALSLLCGAASAEDTPKPPKEKKICRAQTTTGSIMPRSVCHTKTEWVQIDGANARAVENARNLQAGASGVQ